MRLPDDYEDHGSGLTPTVVSAIVAVTIFVVVILTVVLIINRKPASHQQNNTTAQTEKSADSKVSGYAGSDHRKHIDSFGSGFLGYVSGDNGYTDAFRESFRTGWEKRYDGYRSFHRWKAYPGD